MANKVLVGVDDSETAFKAATRAALVAQGLGAELAIVTAYNKNVTDIVIDGKARAVLNDVDTSKQVADSVASRLHNDFPGLAIQAQALPGKPQDVLLDVAGRSECEVLVVGNVGMQGIGRVLGSVASSVAHHAPCDVLIVKTVEQP